MTIDEVERLLALMKSHGLRRVKVGEVELERDAPDLASEWNAAMAEELEKLKATPEAEQPRVTIYDDPDLWPDGQVPRLTKKS